MFDEAEKCTQTYEIKLFLINFFCRNFAAQKWTWSVILLTSQMDFLPSKNYVFFKKNFSTHN